MSNGIASMAKIERDEPKRVLDAICRLAQAHGTPPPQQMIADELDVSQQYVSKMMFVLSCVGAIEWINRYVYSVTDATWEPPPDFDF